jgi:hypothetical protein
MRKLKRWIKWAIFTGGTAVLLWTGLNEGVEGAKNVGLCLAWSHVFLGFLWLRVDVQKDMATAANVIPSAIVLSVDIFIAGLLIWHGYFVTGVMVFIAAACKQHGWAEALKLKDKPL